VSSPKFRISLWAQDAWRFAPDWRAVLGVRGERWQAEDGSLVLPGITDAATLADTAAYCQRNENLARRAGDENGSVPAIRHFGLTLNGIINRAMQESVGTFTLCFTGKYTRTAKNIALNGKWDLSDTYNWNAGQAVRVKGTVIPDDWAIMVEDAGHAQSYPVNGTWTGKQNLFCSGGGGTGGR
jgi:hypothetical protein